MLGDQCRLQLSGDGPSRFVAGHHRVFSGGDDAAQVAQVELFDVGLGRVGTVEPLGDSKHRQQLLGHGQQTGGGHLRLAFGLQTDVLLVDGLADGRDSTLKGTVGDRPLLFG